MASKKQEGATREIELSKLEVNRGQLYGLPKNPRFIRDERFEALKKSIRDDPEMLSLRELIVYPLENGNFLVIGGNMRLRACEELGYEALPCKVLPVETPVAKLRAYVVKDNVAFGENDWDAFANEWDLDELKAMGLELDGIEDGQEEKPEVTEDDFSEEDAEPRCRKGDIWKLGEHRLMCGDSTDAMAVSKLMDGKKADLVFTDPPYNVAIGSKNEILNKFDGGARREVDIKGDKGMSDEECRDTLWTPAFENMNTHAKDHCAIYVTMPQGGTHMMMMMMAAAAAGWQIKHELVWLKDVPTFSMGRLDYDYKHEPICYGWNKNHRFFGAGTQTKSVWEFPKPKKSGEHPTMKPVELVVNAIMNSSKSGEIVLDLFGGSGTTLIACAQTLRECRMMELDEHYCDVILSRWEQLTGRTAEKVA